MRSGTSSGNADVANRNHGTEDPVYPGAGIDTTSVKIQLSLHWCARPFFRIVLPRILSITTQELHHA